MHGEDLDDDYGSEGGSDLIDPPETFDENGSPLGRSSLLDREDELARAMDAAAAAAGAGAFGFGGAGLRALYGQMSGMSTRLKGLLASLKNKNAGPDARLTALQDLSELLSISTEDTLAGYFSVEQFVRELIEVLKGDPTAGQGGDSGMTAEEMIAFGMDPAEAGGPSEEQNVQMMLLACRCLANLMEALPGSSHSVVYAGAVPVLCSKLLEIQYIDLAEQTLSTLEKISEEVPSAIVRENGLKALLQFLDFLSFHVQRTAVTAAANCCRSLSPESFTMVNDAMPIFTNILSYPDQRVVEQGCLAVVRIVDSYRHYPDKLEQLLSAEVLSAVRGLLNPDSSAIGPSTYTQILKMLSTAAKASPEVSIALVELNLASTLHHLLTGVAPADFPPEGEPQILRRTDDDMLVMQNLVQRPKEQVQEALNLVCELLPALPKEGIFDPRAFAGKGGKTKARKEGSRAESPEVGMDDVVGSGSGGGGMLRGIKQREEVKAAALEKRLELLGEGPPERLLTIKRYYALLLPTLVDVYAASVNGQVRTKALTGLLKIVNYCDKDSLASILTTVPMASFLAGLLSSRDQSALVTNALQLIELLLVKMPDAYQYFFRREGVMYEIERVADSPIVSVSKSMRASASQTPTQSEPAPAPSGVARALQQQQQLTETGGSSDEPAPLTATEALAQDMITYRARHLRDEYASADSGGAERATNALEGIRHVVAELKAVSASGDKSRRRQEEAATEVVSKVVALFSDSRNPLSSFELLESGLVNGVLDFATHSTKGGLTVHRRQELLGKAFLTHTDNITPSPAFSLLVKRLLESLSRMEQFEVELAAQSIGEVESKRHGVSMLGRQLKLRLVAEDGADVPRSCTNIVVSIHAIATFQAFNDYLRPRIIAATQAAERLAASAGSSGTPSGRGQGLSNFLAAFAAAGGDIPETPPNRGGAGGAGTGASGAGEGVATRRSSRLSAGGDLAGAIVTEEAVKEEVARSEEGLELSDEDEDHEMEDDADDALFAAAGMEGTPPSRDERPVNLEVADDGSKMVAKTPDGTRVGTPIGAGQAPKASSQTKARPSYAAAVKSEPTDFHLEFSMDDHPIDIDTTIYGAVHRHDARQGPGVKSSMWHSVYTVKFKTVPGPAKAEKGQARLTSPAPADSSVLSNLPSSVPPNSQQAKILQLLWVLHGLNADLVDSSPDGEDPGVISVLPEGAFVNNKLTAKLNRQLEEPMIVASACLPSWATDLPKFFPFLFAFETRYTFLQSTAFGYARLMQKWVGQARTDSSRRDDNLGFLGRLPRQKVRISRDRLLESAFKVFELYGASRAALEVEFFTEVGSGLGPTLEFYALVSKEFARRDLSIWREGDVATETAYVYHPLGLFPSPMADKASEAEVEKRNKLFAVMGQFVAKALMDSRIIDLNLNRALMKLVLDQEMPLTIASVASVDKALAKSLAHLQKYVAAKHAIEADDNKSEEDALAAVAAIEVQGATIADLTLDFTLPGYDIELKAGGKETAVEMTNLEEYIALVIDWTVGKGVEQQVAQFQQGFSTVFPVRDLSSFTPSELVMMTGSLEEDWSVEALTNATKADHGFTMDSRQVKDLLSIMSELKGDERRAFLSFITGSPRLPIGGFAALTPPLTIVRKDGGDGALPSVMTCVNFLKCPAYSSREVVEARFGIAVRDGAEGFHLS